MRRNLTIGIVVVAYVAKVIIGLETGDYRQDTSNADMIHTLEGFFWVFMAGWCAFEGAFDQESDQPIGVVFFLILFGQMVGFWLGYYIPTRVPWQKKAREGPIKKKIL